MHEYSIVQSLLDSVGREAAARDALAVHRLTVRVGELSGVDHELLALAYESFREPTICAHAPLEVITEPAAWVCSGCARPIDRGAVLRCPACDLPARLVAGAEIVLERIELEIPDGGE